LAGFSKHLPLTSVPGVFWKLSYWRIKEIIKI